MHRVSSVPVLASQGTTADWECPSCLQDSCCSLPAWSCSACRGNAHTHASHSFPKGTWQEPAESFAQLMIALKLEIAHPDTFSLSPSLSHTHTLSPEEEIKRQAKGACGGTYQTSSQGLQARGSSKLSKLQLQWEYYASSYLKRYVFMRRPHVQSLVVTPGQQYSTRGCLVYQHNLWVFYYQETEVKSMGESRVFMSVLYLSQEHKHFMPVVVTALLWLLFISLWPWKQHPSNSKGEHLLSRGNLMETPGNATAFLTSSYKSFPKGMSFGLDLAKDTTLFFAKCKSWRASQCYLLFCGRNSLCDFLQQL